jgi:hypothetical protein
MAIIIAFLIQNSFYAPLARRSLSFPPLSMPRLSGECFISPTAGLPPDTAFASRTSSQPRQAMVVLETQEYRHYQAASAATPADYPGRTFRADRDDREYFLILYRYVKRNRGPS